MLAISKQLWCKATDTTLLIVILFAVGTHLQSKFVIGIVRLLKVTIHEWGTGFPGPINLILGYRSGIVRGIVRILPKFWKIFIIWRNNYRICLEWLGLPMEMHEKKNTWNTNHLFPKSHVSVKEIGPPSIWFIPKRLALIHAKLHAKASRRIAEK